MYMEARAAHAPSNFVLCSAGQSNMAVTLDDFGNYTSDPEVNVTKIYEEASHYAQQIRIFTILVSGTPPIKSAAPYGWGVPSQNTLGGSGSSATTGGVPPRRSYFSAECWGTGIALAQTHKTMPLGLISAARGGAAIQSFMSKAAVSHLCVAAMRHSTCIMLLCRLRGARTRG